jgi:hypothetical protein
VKEVMTRRAAAEQGARLVFTTCLLAACLAAVPASAAEKTAPLLFLSVRSPEMLPAPVAELRAAGEAALDSLLSAHGVATADGDVVDAAQVRYRVRSGQVIDPAFLAELHASVGAERLLVVQLLYDVETVFAAGRLIDAETGLLRAAGTVDPRSWQGDGWRPAVDASLEALVTQLLGGVRTVAGPPLVVLPVSARGIAQGEVLTATHTLLETVLADGRSAVADPGVVNHLMITTGHDPRRIGAEGMRVLADTLGARRLLVTQIESYALRQGRTDPVFDDGPTRVRSVLPAFFYLARLTDLRTGTLVGCSSLYHDDRTRYGWFGRVSTRTSRRTLGDAALRLWTDLEQATEDLHD